MTRHFTSSSLGLSALRLRLQCHCLAEVHLPPRRLQLQPPPPRQHQLQPPPPRQLQLQPPPPRQLQLQPPPRRPPPPRRRPPPPRRRPPPPRQRPPLRPPVPGDDGSLPSAAAAALAATV